MRFAFLVAAGAAIGALAAFAVPTSTVQSASDTVQTYGASVRHIPHSLADLNPLRFVYDVVVQRVQQGNTPDQLGFKSSPTTFKPFVMPTSSFDFHRDQNNRRMEDMRAFAQNPAALPR